MPLTYYTAVSDLPCGICAGDTVSLNDEHPAEPVLVHRPVSGACAAKVAAWVKAGVLRPISPSVSSEGASPLASPWEHAPPRLRLLPSTDPVTARSRSARSP